MEAEKTKLIIDILMEDYNLACEQIPLIHEELINLEKYPDEAFDKKGDAFFGHETKTRHIKNLQHQLGYLGAVQAEYLKIFRFLEMDEEELKQVIVNNKIAAETFKAEIEKAVAESKSDSQNNNTFVK